VILLSKRKTVLTSLLLIVLVGPLFATLPLSLNPPQIQPLESTTLDSQYLVLYGDNITSLSHTVMSLEDVGFDPQEAITGVTLENFSLTGGNSFQVYQNDPYALDFSMLDVNLSGIFTINGSPTIDADNVNVSLTLESLGFDIASTIGSPDFTFNMVNATEIQFRVSGGTFSWTNSETNALTLIGFDSAVVQSSTVAGDLTVGGAGNVTISADSTYGNLIDNVDPVLALEQTTINVPYSFVFQSSKKVTINWAAYDNVQGPSFALQTNITINKNGQPGTPITSVVGNSYQVTVDTAAAYYEIDVSVKDSEGNITTETVTIVLNPNVLMFILMIIIIAGAAIGILLVLYWRKQHQWQKTSLVEIPA
jgi:hypothetical protein